MIAPDTGLGLGIVVASLVLTALWFYERDDATPTDPYVLLTLGVAALAGGVTYLGFFDTFQAVMSPVTDTLVNTFGLPARWQSSNGMGAARYTPTDVLRVLVALPVFIYASYRDIKERIVRNWVWYPLFGYGFVFLVYDLVTGSLSFLAPWILGNLVFATVLGYALFRTHLFGGADMKAMWGLGILLPTYPALVISPRVLPPLLAAPHNALNMFALTILANTALVALCWPLYTLARNVRNGSFDASRPGLMFTARHVPLKDALDDHGRILPVWAFNGSGPLSRFKSLILTVVYGFETQFLKDYLDWHNTAIEDNLDDPSRIENHYVERFLNSDANRDEDGNRKWEASNEEEAVEAFEGLLAQGDVWMTPGIPFIIPMFLGLLISLTVGDIVYWLVILLN